MLHCFYLCFEISDVTIYTCITIVFDNDEFPPKINIKFV